MDKNHMMGNRYTFIIYDDILDAIAVAELIEASKKFTVDVETHTLADAVVSKGSVMNLNCCDISPPVYLRESKRKAQWKEERKFYKRK